MKKLLLVLLLLVGCARKDALTFVTIPSEDAMLARDQWKPMIEYLSDSLGQPVELVIASDYAAVVEAMRYGHADIARLSPVGYVAAIDEGADIEPIVVGVKAETGLPGYYAYLVARAGTDTSDLSALTFAFVDPSSTSGYVAPAIYLEQSGIEPSDVLFAGSHQAVILAVQNGSADVGAVASNRLEMALTEEVIQPGELEIIWQSPLIPNCPVVVQSFLPEKHALKTLLLAVPEDILFATGTNETSYVEAKDEDYDPVREAMRFGE